MTILYADNEPIYWLSANEIRQDVGLESVGVPESLPTVTNCPNCGAPIKGNRCEYCGTVFGPTDDDLDSLRKELRQKELELANARQSEQILSGLRPANRNSLLYTQTAQSVQDSIRELYSQQCENMAQTMCGITNYVDGSQVIGTIEQPQLWSDEPCPQDLGLIQVPVMTKESWIQRFKNLFN